MAPEQTKQEAERPAWQANEVQTVESGQLPLAGFGD